MIVASSMSLLLDSRLGNRGGILPWTLLITGALASLGANIAVAEPTITGRVIAAWPSFALTASYELLMRQVRQTAKARAALAVNTRAQDLAVPRVASVLEAPTRPLSRSIRVDTANRRGGRDLQWRAWQWALANRRPDGSLPTGTEMAREFRRSARWGRLVKNTGLTGQLDVST